MHRGNGDDAAAAIISKLVVFDRKDNLAQWINGIILESTFVKECGDRSRKQMLKDILEGFESKDEYLRRLFNFHLSIHLSVLSFNGSILEKKEIRKRVEQIPQAISDLIVLLTEDNELNLRALGVTDVIWKLIMKNELCRKKILEVPEILDRLVGFLSHDEFPRLQSNAVIGLAKLVEENDDIGRRIVNIPGAISRVVRLLTKGGVDKDSCLLHSNAASLMGLLVKDRENKKAILKTPQTLVHLVGLLSPEKHPNILSNVASILGYLAEGEEQDRSGIGQIPGELFKIVFLLSKVQDDCAGLRLWMNATERTLSEPVNDGKLKEMNEKWPDALESLVELLFRDDRPEIRTIVATTLSHLCKENDEVERRIGQIPDAIPKLIEMVLARVGDLDGSDVPVVTVALVEILHNLVQNRDHSKRFLEYPDIIEHMVGLLFCDKDSSLQIHVLALMAHLSKENEEVRRRIGQITSV